MPIDFDIIESSQMRNLALHAIEQRNEKSQELELTVKLQSPEHLLANINVCMSPETGQRSLQPDLTPSEWQSVNDMPRMNRTPLTQRITPMKERIKNKKKDSKLILCSSNDNFVPSSDCSTTSSKAGYNIADDTTCQSFNNFERELMPYCCISESGFDAGKNYNCELEGHTNCGWSDISNGDVPSPADVTGPDQYCSARKKCGTDNDNSIASSSDHSDEVTNIYDPENRCIDDSDSDNDLGRFYSPQAKSSKFIHSTVPDAGSLGYISSYPSTIRHNHDLYGGPITK